MTDGQPLTPEVYAQREAEYAALTARIEAAIGQERHYGIRVWSEQPPGERSPRWFVTDEYRGLDGFAFAHYADTPPPVDVYTRDQYERACAAAGLTPAADADLGTYADLHMPPSLWDLPPLRYVDAQLRLRRLAGLDRETAPERLAAALAAQEAADAAADARLAAARPCAECGKPVLDGMNASGGLACSVPCFEAMSDRPGRYATRGGAR